MSLFTSFRYFAGAGGTLAPPALVSATLLADGYTVRMVWDPPVNTAAPLDTGDFSLDGTDNALLPTGVYTWQSGTTLDIEYDELVATGDLGITLDVVAGALLSIYGVGNLVINDFPVTNNSEIPWVTVPYVLDEGSGTELSSTATAATLIRGPATGLFAARVTNGRGFLAAFNSTVTAAFKTDHSAEVVFRMNAYPASGVYRIFGCTSVALDSGGSIYNFLPGLQISTTGIIAIFWEQGVSGTDATVTSSTSAPLNQWNHVAWTATVNGGNFDIEIFLNGVSVHTGSAILPTAGSDTKLSLGTSVFGSTQRLNGSLYRAILRSGDQSSSFAARASDPSLIVADVNTVGFWDCGVPAPRLWPARFSETELWWRGDNPHADSSPGSWFTSVPNEGSTAFSWAGSSATYQVVERKSVAGVSSFSISAVSTSRMIWFTGNEVTSTGIVAIAVTINTAGALYVLASNRNSASATSRGFELSRTAANALRLTVSDGTSVVLDLTGGATTITTGTYVIVVKKVRVSSTVSTYEVHVNGDEYYSATNAGITGAAAINGTGLYLGATSGGANRLQGNVCEFFAMTRDESPSDAAAYLERWT